jgi:transposase-like protein
MITTMPSDPNAAPPRIEVITSVQRRRRWSAAEKVRLVEETIQPGMSVSYVARRAGVAPSLLFKWRRLMLEGGYQAVQADEDVVGRRRAGVLKANAGNYAPRGAIGRISELGGIAAAQEIMISDFASRCSCEAAPQVRCRSGTQSPPPRGSPAGPPAA